MNSMQDTWTLIILMVIVALSSSASASNFQIEPTYLELGNNVKSGVFSVINGDSGKLNVQISVKEWSQNADGKDVYEETKAIVFFPKIMAIEPHEQRAIRIGIKTPPSLREKTYRLFVEEIATAKKTQGDTTSGEITAGLTIAFRYATPIFVKPARLQESGVMENMEMSNGLVKTLVKNTGNVHLKVLTVKFRGKAADGRELFSREAGGWYILHGLSRPYEMTVPKDLCGSLATIEIIAQAENLTINGTLNVQKTMCTQ